MSINLVTPSNHLILCLPFLLPWIFPSIRVFSCELALHFRWPKYWNSSLNIPLWNVYSNLLLIFLKLGCLIFFIINFLSYFLHNHAHSGFQSFGGPLSTFPQIIWPKWVSFISSPHWCLTQSFVELHQNRSKCMCVRISFQILCSNSAFKKKHPQGFFSNLWKSSYLSIITNLSI